MTNIINDVITGLSGSWDTDVTSLPKLLDGSKEVNRRGRRKNYKNVIFVYDKNTRNDLVEPTHVYRDSTSLIKLEIETSQSENKRDDIFSECMRIIGQTGISGYDNRKILLEKLSGDSSSWTADIMFNLMKYNEEI